MGKGLCYGRDVCRRMYDTGREKVMEGTLVFVALDDKQKPKQLDCVKSI